MKKNLGSPVNNLIRFNSANVLVSVVDFKQNDSNIAAILADISSSLQFLKAVQRRVLLYEGPSVPPIRSQTAAAEADPTPGENL